MAELKHYKEPLQNNVQEPNSYNIQEPYQNNTQEFNSNNIQADYQNNISESNQNNIPLSNQINSNREIVNDGINLKMICLKIICYIMMIILIIVDIKVELKAIPKLNADDPDDDSANVGGIAFLFLFIGLISLFLLILCCSCCDATPIIKIIIFIIIFVFRWILINNNFYDKKKISNSYGNKLKIINLCFLIIAIIYQIIAKIALKLRL